MKKTAFIIILISALSCLISCAGKIDTDAYIQTLNEAYSANVTIREQSAEYTARIIRSEGGRLDIVFAEPTMLWGMGYSFDGEDSCLIYNGMNIELNGEEPDGAGVYHWRKLLTPSAEYEGGVKQLNEKTVICVSGGGCEIYFDRESKNPLQLVSGNTVITFNEFEREVINNNGTEAVTGTETEGVGGN